MKIFSFFLVICLFPCSLKASTVIWDGGGNDGLWSTAANWSADMVPQATDDVVLDNSLTNNSYIVSLPSGAINVSVLSLTITPSGVNVITLILPTTNTANPGFSVTGPGNALVLNDRAVFKNSSGASTGSGISISNTFRINNGGHYIHNTSRGNASIVSQLSTAAGTESGIFEFDVPTASYVVSLSNRTFGKLLLSAAANNNNTSYSGSGASALTINSDLQINTGVSLSLSMSGTVNIKGNFIQAAASTFNLQSSVNNNVVQVKGNFISQGTITETNSGLPVLEFNGTANQQIDAANAVFLNNVDFKINNNAGLSLLGNLNLPYRFTFFSGNISLGNFDLSTSTINQISPASLTNNHVITNGTGVLKLAAVATAVFPIGPSASSYNPITITNGNGLDYFVRVEEGINPAVAFPGFGINRTWYIRSSSVASVVGLTFQYASADANANALQPQDMEILMNTGNAWNIVTGNTNISPTGTDPSWKISTVVPVGINSVSTPYALGVDGGWTLPVCTNCTIIPRLLPSVKTFGIKIYPNPVTDELHMIIQSPAKTILSLTVIDLFGNPVKQIKIQLVKGNNNYTMNLQHLHHGIYFIRAETDLYRQIIKFTRTD
jgi:hypothetical protein